MNNELSLEEFNADEVTVAAELAGRIQRIKVVGICREDYDVIEQNLPGVLSGIDRRKLTVQPSKTMQGVAVEALGEQILKIAGAAVVGGTVGYLVAKLINWIQSKLGSGGGSSGSTVEDAIATHNKSMSAYIETHNRNNKKLSESMDKTWNSIMSNMKVDEPLNEHLTTVMGRDHSEYTSAIISQIYKGNEGISTRDFDRHYSNVTKSPIYNKNITLAVLLAGPKPVSGAVLTEKVIGKDAGSIIADMRGIVLNITNAIDKAVSLTKAKNSINADLELSGLKNQVERISKSSQSLIKLRDTPAFNKVRELSRTKFTLRVGTDYSQPSSELIAFNFTNPGIIKLPSEDMFKDLRSIRPLSKSTTSFWDGSEHANKKAEFNKTMKELGKVVSNVMSFISVLYRYERDTIQMYKDAANMYPKK